MADDGRAEPEGIVGPSEAALAGDLNETARASLGVSLVGAVNSKHYIAFLGDQGRIAGVRIVQLLATIHH